MPEALSVFTVPCLLTSPCFGFRQNVPLLAKERDNRVRSQFPLLCEGEGCLRSRRGEVSLLVEPVVSCPPILTSPCFGFRQNVPLLVKERDQRVRFAILHLVMLSEVKHPCTG